MQPKPRVNQKINLTVQRLGIHGEGIGYWHGFTVFVDGALPGEVIQARLTEGKRRYGRARISVIDSPSPDRVEPPCPLFGRCGGCQLMHYKYEAQLAMKRQRVIDALERIGKMRDFDVAPCIPSPSPLHYRNKIQVPVRRGENGIEIGFHARNTHDLIDVPFCHIHCAIGQKVYEEARNVIKQSSLVPYEFASGEGELRYMIIKTAVATEQALVVLVTSMPPTEELRRAAKLIIERSPFVKGVVHHLNANPDNVVLGQESTILEGAGAIEERICGLRFDVSPESFFQVNPQQAEALYEEVAVCAGLTGKEVVWDAFCGVGTLSLVLSKYAKKVIGVECVPQAVEDARQNALKNEIGHAEFVCDHAENYVQSLEPVDVVVLNPPRKGCESLLLDKVGRLSPKRIVYVSCDPATLARDLAHLSAFGYRISRVQPFDMFPQTAHVETVVLCEHKEEACNP